MKKINIERPKPDDADYLKDIEPVICYNPINLQNFKPGLMNTEIISIPIPTLLIKMCYVTVFDIIPMKHECLFKGHLGSKNI